MLRLQMEADTRIPVTVSNAIMDSFNAAANPSAESPEVVIQSLPQEDRAMIVPFTAAYGHVLGGVALQGQIGLMNMTDEQWNALLDDDA